MPTNRFLSLVITTIVAAGVLASPASGTPAATRQLWSQIFESGFAYDLALAPNGTAVYVTGCNPSCGGSIQTVAYSVGSSRQLWSASFSQGVGGYGLAIAASPDGTRIFVTGWMTYAKTQYQTIAYNAATGVQLWAAEYDAGGAGGGARHLGVSPDGAKVFVTGESAVNPREIDFATVAYDAATGLQLWAALYGQVDSPTSTAGLGVSPDGSQVFVTGASKGPNLYNDYVTIAYDATSGSQRWVALYNNPNKYGDTPFGLAISPDSSRVFVTGCQGTIDLCVDGDYLTIAYDTATGTQLWLATYNGSVNGSDTANRAAVSPDGSLVFVTGTAEEQSGFEAVTIAYDAATGSERWLAAFTPEHGKQGTACCLAVSADGSRLIVAGADWNGNTDVAYRTIGYNPATGSQLWTARFAGGFYSAVSAVGVTRNGQVALVAGTTIGPDHQYDFGTIAYRA